MSAKDDGGGSSGRNSTYPSPCRPPSINELDNFDSAKRWMEKGRTDAKGFAKYLPHTSQDLRKGKVTPEQVSGELEGIYKADVRIAGGKIDAIKGLLYLTIMKALPAHFFHTKTQHMKTSFEFSIDLRNKYMEKAQRQLNQDSRVLRLKESLDEVCEMWADRLDKMLFRGKTGMFLKKCPLFGITPETFCRPGMPIRLVIDDIGNSWSEEEQFMSLFRKDYLLTATKNVTLGLQDVTHLCWECETFSECDLQHCAKCKTAVYCSRGCQISAWKQGHKLKCNALGSKYSAFKESMSTLDDAYKRKTGSAVAVMNASGIAFCDEIDYRVLEMVMGIPSPYEGTEFATKLGEFQMETFYKNIGRVTRGEFWFYDDTDDLAYEIHRKANLTQKTELEDFIILCLFMGYDYVGIYPGISTFYESSSVMRAKEQKGGVEMPASRFIEIYKAGRRTSDSTDRFRLRRDIRNQCIRYLIDAFHK